MNDRLTASTINDAQLDALYAEADRLRAGEEDGYDPAALPTPGQWMKRYNDATAEERLDQVTRLVKAADHGHACMMHMHEVHIRDGREAETAVRRVRALLAGRWGKVDPDLVRAALDGTEPPTEASLPASTHPAAAAHPLVQGRCPACRGASLFLGSGGYLTCARLDCPNPSAADDLMHGEQPRTTPKNTPTSEEQPMPATDKTPCTATINGPHVPDDETLTCTVTDIDRHPANHVGPKREYGTLLWTDHHAGAVPHATTEPTTEQH